MYTTHFPRVQRLRTLLCALLTPVVLLATALVAQQSHVNASSHREAPLISMDAYADNTDTYVFISPTNPDNIVLVASWIPFEGPEGGPNYFEWHPNVFYDIHVDNDGDAVPDFTYTLKSTTNVQNPLTFLYNTGPIAADGTNWNRQQRYTVTETSEGGTKTLLDNVLAPPVNIGSKSTPNYESLNNNFIYTVEESGDPIKIYAGTTDDAFWVDLQVFDLLTLRGQQSPVGYAEGNNIPVDSVAGFNNHSLVLQIPISRLRQGDESVLGVWATARRPSMRVLQGLDGLGGQENTGTPVQVSRLGMPLVNEVVLPYALKDAFNALKPEQDLSIYTHPSFGPILQKSVEDPEVGRLLCGLYGVPLPGDSDDNCSTEVEIGMSRSGRGDIFDIFLTGMVLADTFMIQTATGPALLPPGFNVNRPANVVPAEMIRINTNIKGDLCSPTPSRLGVLGGDACGFPNGRRLFDDIVEIELLAVAGAAYQVLDGRDETFTFNPALIGVLDDNVDYNDKPFRTGFPYMALAQSGQEHIHLNPEEPDLVVSSIAAFAAAAADDAEESSQGKVRLNSRDLELGTQHGKAQTVGIRFPGVDVPAGARIINAYIEFTAEANDDDPATLTFRGEATGNALPFTGQRSSITQRPTTSTEVSWSDVPAWTKGRRYWSVNLNAIVQEIVDRSDWTNGNAIALIVTGSGERSAWAYNGKPSDSAMLYVTYAVGGATVTSRAALSEETMVVSTVSSTLLRSGPDSGELLPDDDDSEGLEVDAANTTYLPAVER